MQRSALCRSQRELSNEYLLAKFGVDTAENGPSKIWRYGVCTPPSPLQGSTGGISSAQVMIESNLLEGNQKIPKAAPPGQTMLQQLQYGVSVTDGCVSWTSTVEIYAFSNSELERIFF